MNKSKFKPRVAAMPPPRLTDLIAPKPPTWLSKAARVEWRRLAPIAYNLGSLKVATLRSFGLLCEALGAEALARRAIEKEGLTITAGNGGQKAHPALKVAEAARKEAAGLLRDFGMRPVSSAIGFQAPDGGLEAIEDLDDRLVAWPDEPRR